MVSIVLVVSFPPSNVAGILLNWTFEGKVPTDSPTNSLPSVAEASNGTLWLVWQSLPPIPATIPKILMKTFHFPSQAWSDDTPVTSGTETDTAPDVTPLANDTMMVVWARDSSDSDIYHRLSTGTQWSPEVRLTSGPAKDLSPSVFQDRGGRIWVVWERRNPETVVYDDNQNNLYDSGEIVISGLPPMPGTALKEDGKVKYSDTNNNNVWEENEPMIYDSNNDNTYNAGEPIITTAPPVGSPVEDTDPKVKYVDANNNNSWEFSPSDIYYKTYDGSWSNDIRLTTDSQFDQRPSIAQTKDGRVWIVWSSNRNNRQMDLFFRTYDGTTWSNDTILFNDSDTSCQQFYPLGCDDTGADIVQDRDGSIRVFWSRFLPVQSIGLLGEIFTIESTDNGLTFSTVNQQRLTSNDESDIGPAVFSFKDTRLRVFWTRPSSGLPGVVDILYMKSDPVFTHDIAVGSVTLDAVAVWNTTFRVTVNVTNQGDFSENAIVTLNIGSAIVSTLSLPVDPGGTVTIKFNVDYNNTTLLPPGRHSVTASAAISVEPAGNLPDNSMTAISLISLLPPGDMDHDEDVELVDAVIWTQSYGSTPGSPSWNSEADLNGSGTVDMEDAALFARWIGLKV